jgi:hypothetical protein
MNWLPPGMRPRERQIDFPPLQRHSRRLEVGLVIFAILCIIVAVIISKATGWGVTTRPI